MRKLILVAALALLSTWAHAAGHDLKFGGRTIHIDVPRNCKQISCIHVNAKEKPSRASRRTYEPENTSVAPAVTTSAAAPAAAATTTSTPAQTASTASRAEPRDEYRSDSVVDDPKPVARLSLPTPDEDKPLQAATNTPAAEPVRPAEPSPLGVWLTEKGEGKVRIEECGSALCGHTEGRPNEKVLINMEPSSKNRWNGKIHDIRSGSTYMSHMSLKGANALRVEGCALGGLFCGGQTWSRVQ
jgi:hypothetical protein